MVSTVGKKIALLHRPPATPASNIQHLLVDQLLPRLAAQLGHLVLHASGVEHNGHAYLFLGATGFGKSTLAASFLHDGYTLMTDDAICLEREGEELLARPLVKDLRLNPDSIAHLFAYPPWTSTVASYSAKMHVHCRGLRNGLAPASLGGLFVLDPRPDPSEARIAPMLAAEACMALVENSFSLDIHDLERASTKLEACALIASKARAFRMTYSHDYQTLPRLRAAIRAAVAGHGNQRDDQRDRVNEEKKRGHES